MGAEGRRARAVDPLALPPKATQNLSRPPSLCDPYEMSRNMVYINCRFCTSFPYSRAYAAHTQTVNRKPHLPPNRSLLPDSESKPSALRQTPSPNLPELAGLRVQTFRAPTLRACGFTILCSLRVRTTRNVRAVPHMRTCVLCLHCVRRRCASRRSRGI